jgi:hypothetical protein
MTGLRATFRARFGYELDSPVPRSLEKPMAHPTYRFVFASSVPIEEVAGTLRLSVLAAESLHGESEVALDARHEFDVRRRQCTIAAGTPAGRDLAKLFGNLSRREFGPDSFEVERVEERRSKIA